MGRLEQNQLNIELINAAINGNLTNVKLLIEKGAAINYDKDRALIDSSRYGHLNIVKYLVENGADIHAEDDVILNFSTQSGNLAVVKYLVGEKKLDINNPAKHTLKWGAYNGHLEIVKYLVEQGADIYINNNEVLKEAAKQGRYEVMYYLIVDCNMLIDKKTLTYLKKLKLKEALSLINTRELYNKIDKELETNYKKQTKIKI